MKKLILCLYLAACTGSFADELTVTVQNIGLQQNVAVPPLGAGVAPVLGFPGDGAPVVTRVGGWSSGPGAIKWHGGQWVIPHTGPSNTSIANVSCDVVPRPDATDLIELVGNAGTAIASMTIPATTANIIIRGWLLPSVPYSIGDGENIVIRHTPRDSITGAFTSASQDMTVISCAVNANGGAPLGPTIGSVVLSAGNNNNWNPPGFANASMVRITTGGGSPFLTGLAGGIDGRQVVLTLASMGDPLTITTSADSSSLDANRFLIPLPASASFLQLTAVNQSVILLYDGIASKWRVVGRNF